MPTNLPGAVDTIANLPTNRTDATANAAAHSADHDTLAGAVLFLEGKVGAGATPLNAALSKLPGRVVNLTQTAIPHGLSGTPTQVFVLSKDTSQIWQSAAPDATNVYLTATSNDTAVPVSPLAPLFPRVATLFSKTNQNTNAANIAKFPAWLGMGNIWFYVVNWGGVSLAGTNAAAYLKTLNPQLMLTWYQHSCMYSDTDTSGPESAGFVVGGVTYYVDLNWHLTYAGSTLTGALTNVATSVPVADLTRFTVNDRILIAGSSMGDATAIEMCQITAKSASTGGGNLTVTRGVNSQGGKFPAVAHNSGEHVRTICHAFGGLNVLLMNVTSTCLPTSINATFGSQTWAQFMASFVAINFAQPQFLFCDGIFLDNYVDGGEALVDVVASTDVDINRTNTASGVTNAQWTAGMTALSAGIAAVMPRSIMGNTGGAGVGGQATYLNGAMVEGAKGDLSSGFVANPLAFYQQWSQQARQPQSFLFNFGANALASLGVTQTAYQVMRFGLTVTLTNGNGFYCYDDINFDASHSTFWWYDEYDNAGAGVGYLGIPLGMASQPITGVYVRQFTNGIVVCNTTGSSQNVALGATFQAINGSQVPSINNGAQVSSVTIAAQDGQILLRTALCDVYVGL